MENKNLYYFLVLIVVIGGLGFFYTKNKDAKKYEITDKSDDLEKESLADDDSEYKLLAIDPNKCIGCNKCVRFDSEHFEMMGNKARVISSKNLSSNNLKTAINICPTMAISLN